MWGEKHGDHAALEGLEHDFTVHSQVEEAIESPQGTGRKQSVSVRSCSCERVSPSDSMAAPIANVTVSHAIIIDSEYLARWECVARRSPPIKLSLFDISHSPSATHIW